MLPHVQSGVASHVGLGSQCGGAQEPVLLYASSSLCSCARLSSSPSSKQHQRLLRSHAQEPLKNLYPQYVLYAVRDTILVLWGYSLYLLLPELSELSLMNQQWRFS